MTQRTFIDAPVRPGRIPSGWLPFGEAVATVFGTLFGPPAADPRDLPPEVLRDRDPARYEALCRAERTRLALDPDRRPLLY